MTESTITNAAKLPANARPQCLVVRSEANWMGSWAGINGTLASLSNA